MMNKISKHNDMLGLIVAFVLAGGSVAIALDHDLRSGQSHSQASEDILLNSNSLIANRVIDQAGKELGTVKDLLINEATGQVAYIVLAYGGAFGGTLGINRKTYSIPWKELNLVKNNEALVIQVAQAPVIESLTTQRHEFDDHVNEVLNHSTIEAVEGIVENVDNELWEEGVDKADTLIVLDIKTKSGNKRVRIAPENFLNNQIVGIQVGDSVKVEGSRIPRDGHPLILASKLTLKKNGKILVLRNDDRTPKWNLQGEIRAKSKANK